MMSPLLLSLITLQNWGTGKIKIINFKDDVISFGSDANGITADQLAQIDIGGATVVMGSDGKLSTEKLKLLYPHLITLLEINCGLRLVTGQMVYLT